VSAPAGHDAEPAVAAGAGGGSAKVHTQGTHRTRRPEETWELMAPRLPRFGITRVSDVTGLDVFSVPVAMAARPLAWTLSVSQGKGQTLTAAKVSAAMESVELWHAEHARPPLLARAVAAADVGLGHPVRALASAPGPFLDDHTPLDWVAGRGLVSGRAVPVPIDEVCFPDPSTQRWAPDGLRATTNGLASGNSRDEAALHALYEVVERDALSRPSAAELARAPVVDPDSVGDPACRAMLDAIAAAGSLVSLTCLPSRFGVPTFKCLVWGWDFPVVCGGSGSHHDPAVALSRAVTEAAQGRLAAIVGSRDDLDLWNGFDRAHGKARVAASFATPDTTYDAAVAGTPGPSDDITSELCGLAAVVQEVTGIEPVLVDLSTEDDFAVVKVLAPGTAMDMDRVHRNDDRFD
jgi:ribosomal protein S12 methylthiotransferase accessory factor